MTANEQLLAQIRELIALLTQEKAGLQAGSKLFNDRTRQIEGYAASLRKLTGEATASARELKTLERQFATLTTELTKDPSQRAPRLRAGGVRTRLEGMPRLGGDPMAATNASLDEMANEAPKAARAAAFSREVNDQLNESQKRVTKSSKEEKEALRALKEEQKRAAKEAKALAEEQERIARNRNIGSALPGGQAAAKNLYDVAGKVDPRFNAETLRRVETEPSTNISRATFQYATDEGIIKKTTLTVDKFGKVLVDTQKRFRSFGSAIGRDIGEVLKWSIAVGAVYGPIQKFGELLQTMVENESALAAVTTTLGNAQKSMVEIFDAANGVAQEVGENVNKVIEAYNLAYRATGGIESSTARFTVANRLLTDALTLSKLSALDEAEAIDTLSAALKQVAKPNESLEQTLSRGSELLDKWVAVSKVANVDLATLATGFSVVGDAADAAGIDTDRLNAVIATISETTSMSGKEVANTAKAMIAGFQSDNAIKALTSLGIAVVDTEGKARNFLDISQDISEMFAKGIIDETQFSKLTLAIGGGTRRQAPVSTFISNLGKIEEIQKASKEAAEGGAMAALGKQMDTVQTASTKLGNAFQSLAEALGESGGILDLTKNFLLVITDLTSAFAELMNMAGKAGPVLLTSLAAFAIIKGQGPGFKDKMLTSIKENALNGFLNAGLPGQRNAPFSNMLFGNDANTYTDRAGKFARFVSNPMVLGKAAGIGSGLFAGAENLSQGKNIQAAGNVFGSVAGTALGATLGGPMGAMIGGALGSSIAEGFVNAAESYKPQFQDLFADVFEKTPDATKPQTETDLKKKAQEDALEYVKEITHTGGLTGMLTKTVLNAAGGTTDALTKFFKPGSGGTGFKGVNDSQSLLMNLEMQKRVGLVSDEQYGEAYKRLQEANAPTSTEIAAKNTENEFKSIIDAAIKAEQASLLSGLSKGDVGLAPYRQGRDSLNNLGAIGSQYYNQFGKESGMSAEDVFGMTARVTSRLKPEQYQDLTQMSGDIQLLTEKLAQLKTTDEDYQSTLQERNALVDQAAKTLRDLNQQVLAQAKLLQQVNFEELSSDDVNKVVEEARKQYGQDLSAQVAEGVISEEQKAAIIASLDEILVKSAEAYEKITGVPADYLNKALADLKEQGAILDKQKGIGFQSFDMTSQEMMGLVEGPNSQYAKLKAQLEANGYQADEQDQINIFNDGVIQPMKKDWKIVQFLLQEILDVNQKQLDGMYNLPEGSSFWIPAQAAKLYPQGGGGLEKLFNEMKGAGKETETLTDLPDTGPSEGMLAFRQSQAEASRYAAEKPQAIQPPANWEENVRNFRQADKDSMLGKPVEFKPAETTNPILDFLKSFLGMFNQQVPNNQITPGAGNSGIDLQGLFQSITSNLTTKLSLSIDNRMSVTLNGRELAFAIKPYLKDDLVRYSNGASSRSVSII